ncbi:unnamed protein product, partial [Closterium sp. NIES-53]
THTLHPTTTTPYAPPPHTITPTNATPHTITPTPTRPRLHRVQERLLQGPGVAATGAAAPGAAAAGAAAPGAAAAGAAAAGAAAAGAAAPGAAAGSSGTSSAGSSVLTFDAEGRAVDFEVRLDDLQLFLQSHSKDGLSQFDLTSGASTAPAADADSAVARLAVRSHLPSTERAHFSQYKSAKTLYDAVVARYSSPATAALSRLMLPYLFPDLAAFATVADLITHLCTSDTRYRAALPAEFCAKNPPPPHVHHPLLPSHPAP